MTFDIGNCVVLRMNYDIKTDDFVGRIFGIEETWAPLGRLKLTPLSIEHELYSDFSREYLINNCSFPPDAFVHEVKTNLIQMLLDGCSYAV